MKLPLSCTSIGIVLFLIIMVPELTQNHSRPFRRIWVLCLISVNQLLVPRQLVVNFIHLWVLELYPNLIYCQSTSQHSVVKGAYTLQQRFLPLHHQQRQLSSFLITLHCNPPLSFNLVDHLYLLFLQYLDSVLLENDAHSALLIRCVLENPCHELPLAFETLCLFLLLLFFECFSLFHFHSRACIANSLICGGGAPSS